ncbi:diguanylate cyclase [Gorillibacterium sp. sgz5001074]|uniref:GGDEF domain-containing protein n=1 Tax=Gorillibacterium sp. sgz5001074 TaxID=3446695 RepID=UPI003F66220F
MTMTSTRAGRADLSVSLYAPDCTELRISHAALSLYDERLTHARIRHWESMEPLEGCLGIKDSVRSESGLAIRMEPIPGGYLPWLEAASQGLPRKAVHRAALGLARTFSALHAAGFIYGFALPELIYLHPETGSFLLLLQPLPAATPLIENVDNRLPSALFSLYARLYRSSPAADHYLLGLILYVLLHGRLPATLLENPERERREDPLTSFSLRLLHHPEGYRHIGEVRQELVQLAGGASDAVPEELPDAPAAPELHPAVSHPDPDTDRTLREFLSSEDAGILALIGRDQPNRFSALRWKMNECSEFNLFFTILCSDTPLGVLKDLIDRTLSNTAGWAPEAAAAMNTWRSSFEYLLKQYYKGKDGHLEIVEWLYSLFRTVSPLFPQRLCYIFEDCQAMDPLSALILAEFWRRYGDQVQGLRVLFSGGRLPEVWRTPPHFPVLHTDLTSVLHYERILLRIMGRAEDTLVEKLAAAFHGQARSPHDCRLILGALRSDGLIVSGQTGWKLAGLPDWENRVPTVEQAYRTALRRLPPGSLKLIRTLSWLPMPVRPLSLLQLCGLDRHALFQALEQFHDQGAAAVFHANSLFIPARYRDWLMSGLSPAEIRYHQIEALEWLARVRPHSFTPLYELARAASDPYRQQYFLIRSYRRNRSHLSLEKTAGLLSSIIELQPQVHKPENKGWARLLGQVYLSLAQDTAAAEVTRKLYERHGCESDRLFLLLLKLSLNELNVDETRDELYPYLYSPDQPILIRALAAQFMMQSMMSSPLPQEQVAEMDRYFSQVIFPSRNQLPLRIYSELCAVYAGMSFRMLPDRKEWTLALLRKLLGTIEESHSPYLSLRIYNALTFQSNIRTMAEYNRLFIESANRSGVANAAQIGHLNALAVSIFVGDVPSYRYHLSKINPDQFDYESLLNSYMVFQLLYAAEWKDWEVYNQANSYFEESRTLSPTAERRLKLCRSYQAFRRGEPLPGSANPEAPDDSFIAALTHLVDGQEAEGLDVLERIIEQETPSPHGLDIIVGWSFRELLRMKLADPDVGAEELDRWIGRFDSFIHTRGFDLFTPDYSRLKAECLMRLGQRDEAYLHFRSARNGFQAIGKEEEAEQVADRMEEAARPAHWEEDRRVCLSPMVLSLLKDRSAMMDQLTDLRVHQLLAESLNQSLNLPETMERITHFLFHYYPVRDCRIRFRSKHTDTTEIRVPHGIVDAARAQEMVQFSKERLSFEWMNQNGQSISMDLGMRSSSDTKVQSLRYFLQLTKPYIQNCLLYMEMITDSLTGLYVRRHFMELLAREFDISRRYNLGLSVIMMDLDNFRLVNEHGHQEGDRVLEEVSSLLRTSTGNEDILGRYGGEEFIVILPKADGKEALRKAQRICRLIEDTFSYGRPYRVTASIGVSSVDHLEVSSMEELIKFADNAEIHAKKTGKNKVVSAWSI